MKKILIAVGLILIFGVSLVWLNPNPSQDQEMTTPKIRVGYIPIADCSQLFVGLEKNFFKDEGLELDLIPMAGGAKILEALGVGELDIGFSNVVSLIFAREAGLPFVGISGGPTEDENHKEHAILVRTDGLIKKITDLEGMKIALNTRKNIDELMVTFLLKKYGVDPSTVHFIEVPFPRMLGVLSAAHVDAVAAIEPFVTLGMANTEIQRLTYNYLEIQPVTEISTYVANESWIKENDSLKEKFVRAMGKASKFANENPQDVRKFLLKYTKLKADMIQKFPLPYFSEKLSDKMLLAMLERVKELGWINSY